MANIQTLESKTLFSGYASLIPGVTAHHCFRESGQRFLWPDLHITKPGVSTGLVWNGEVHSSGSSLSYYGFLLMLFTCSQHPLQLSVRDIHGAIQQLSSSEWCRHPAECTPIIIEMTSLSVHHSLSLCLPAKLLNNGNHLTPVILQEGILPGSDNGRNIICHLSLSALYSAKENHAGCWCILPITDLRVSLKITD